MSKNQLTKLQVGGIYAERTVKTTRVIDMDTYVQFRHYDFDLNIVHVEAWEKDENGELIRSSKQEETYDLV